MSDQNVRVLLRGDESCGADRRPPAAGGGQGADGGGGGLGAAAGAVPGHHPRTRTPAPRGRALHRKQVLYCTVYCAVLYITIHRVIIAGFLTDGPAIKLQDKLRIGDWIRSIDGHQVSGENDKAGETD